MSALRRACADGRAGVGPGATHRASQETPCASWSAPLAGVSAETSELKSELESGLGGV